MDTNKEILREKFLRCAVESRSVADFLDRYYRPERYRGRGEDAMLRMQNSYKEEFGKVGYCFISRHDSITGRTVSWFGPPKP